MGLFSLMALVVIGGVVVATDVHAVHRVVPAARDANRGPSVGSVRIAP
jgi:hypothetical protein